MGISIGSQSVDMNLRDEIERMSGQKLSECYLCGKCTAGCPVASYQDIAPHVVMRMAQLGNKAVLESAMVWNCVACGTCVTRCPNDVDPARVCEAIANIAKRQGLVKNKAALAFREKFVDSIRNNGRLHELPLALQMKLASKDYTSDVDLGVSMFVKGKLRVFSEQIEGLKALQDLMKPKKAHTSAEKAEGDA